MVMLMMIASMRRCEIVDLARSVYSIDSSWQLQKRRATVQHVLLSAQDRASASCCDTTIDMASNTTFARSTSTHEQLACRAGPGRTSVVVMSTVAMIAM